MQGIGEHQHGARVDLAGVQDLVDLSIGVFVSPLVDGVRGIVGTGEVHLGDGGVQPFGDTCYIVGFELQADRRERGLGDPERDLLGDFGLGEGSAARAEGFNRLLCPGLPFFAAADTEHFVQFFGDGAGCAGPQQPERQQDRRRGAQVVLARQQ